MMITTELTMHVNIIMTEHVNEYNYNDGIYYENMSNDFDDTTNYCLWQHNNKFPMENVSTIMAT